MKYALISVSDKEGVIDFARGLNALGYGIISTGNTHSLIEADGIPAIPIEDITSFPESLDGRVKTLHPHIHGGILAVRDNPVHMSFLSERQIDAIDIVVVNLYPFKEAISRPGLEEAEIIEQIDIGGPALIRSAAKNHAHVTVVVSKDDYALILDELNKNKAVNSDMRKALAIKAFGHTAAYDAMIYNYFNNEPLPDRLILSYEKAQSLRYGENPHQAAAFYQSDIGVKHFEQLHGKELSFNNINDAYGALALLSEFDEPAAVAVKHATPCGVGVSQNIFDAYAMAYQCDPIAIFGGIVAINRPIDKETALELAKTFLEIVIAPDFEAEALEVLTKKKQLRLLKQRFIPKFSELDLKRVPYGMLAQSNDEVLIKDSLEHVTTRPPSQNEVNDMLFGYKVAKHLKSNAIAIVKGGQTLGLCGGQVSRIAACRIALANAVDNFGKEALQGATMASDGFFPFDDCVIAAAELGITAVIQPGGSKNDQASIDTCNKLNISMSLAHIRHFKH